MGECLCGPFLPLRSLSRVGVSTLCLFPSYPVTWRSFLQLWWYRSSFASFHVVFCENCSTCIVFLLCFCGGVVASYTSSYSTILMIIQLYISFSIFSLLTYLCLHVFYEFLNGLSIVLFLIQFYNLCIIFRMFRQFRFHCIIDVIIFNATILLFIFRLYRLFIASHFLFCFLLECFS